MMAKTFENIADSAAVNYQLVLAQSTWSLNDQPPATAPLNLLMTPYLACVILLRLLMDRRCHLSERALLTCASQRLFKSRLVPSLLTLLKPGGAQRPQRGRSSRVMPPEPECGVSQLNSTGSFRRKLNPLNAMGSFSQRGHSTPRNSMGSLNQRALRRSTSSVWARVHEMSVQQSGEKAGGKGIRVLTSQSSDKPELQPSISPPQSSSFSVGSCLDSRWFEPCCWKTPCFTCGR